MRTTITRSLAAIGLALAMFATTALPALATGPDTAPGVLVFSGTATVHNGLGIPTFPGNESTWTFKDGPNQFPAILGDCLIVSRAGIPQGGIAGMPCDITAEGLLGALASPAGINLGGWCGGSQGYNGKGDVTMTWTGDTIDFNVGWVSAGTVLALHGHWDKDADSKPSPNGLLAGLVQAYDNGGCPNGTGGQSSQFSVIGIVAFL